MLHFTKIEFLSFSADHFIFQNHEYEAWTLDEQFLTNEGNTCALKSCGADRTV